MTDQIMNGGMNLTDKSATAIYGVYTALVYQGPGLVQKINRGLVELLERDGFNSIVEAVGMENRPNNKTCEGHE